MVAFLELETFLNELDIDLDSLNVKIYIEISDLRW